MYCGDTVEEREHCVHRMLVDDIVAVTASENTAAAMCVDLEFRVDNGSTRTSAVPI